MTPTDTMHDKGAVRADERGSKTVESPALVPAARNHADKFAAAAKAAQACAPNASHWDKVHVAAGIDP
jgi:hypothetical protein